MSNIADGFGRAGLWNRLAWIDVELLYTRSLFGMAWVALAFGLFILVKIVVFGSIASVEADYFAIWLGVGFWLWTLLQSVVVDGCRTFMSSRNWILGTSVPLSLYAFQTVTRAFVRFVFALPAVVLLFVLMGWTPTTQWLWALPGMAALVLNSVWVALFLGTLCSRYNDLLHLTQSVMQVTFFLTPILYVPEQLGSIAWVLDWNPLTHFIAVVRDPIVGNGLPMLSWAVVGGFTVFGWLAALITFGRMGRFIPFYVS